MAYAVNQEKVTTDRICSKVKSSSFLESLVPIDRPRKTQTRCANCPELHFWNVGEEAGDVLLQEVAIVLADQVGKEEVKLEEGLERRLAAAFDHPGS